jgi:hypothetical protein
MKVQLLCAASAAAFFVIGAASAGELADACAARLEADGRDTSGCTCLEEKVQDDAALAEEMTALADIDDPAERYAAASPAAQAAMDACTR